MIFKLKNRLMMMITLISLLFLITACGSTTSNAQKKYYTGYDSVQMRFLSDSPPSVFYYDSEANNYQANTIPIFVEIFNKGSSDTFGALFIHGFDPNIVAIEGYTQGFPGYSGPIQQSGSFSGWYGDSDNFAVSAIGVPIGDSIININLQKVDGQTGVSFSTFGSRSTLFSSLGFTTITGGAYGYSGINNDVIQGNIGAVLNPITQGMFDQFGWDGWLKQFALQGRNPYNPAGEMDVIEFPATILTLPPSLEEFRQRVMVTSCFDYATHASTMVCIDPEPYSNVKKACTPSTVSAGSGQGAPVAITTIEQRPGRGRTTFIINVKHNKKGTYDELYDYFSLYKCDPASGATVKTNDKNIVYVGYVYLSQYDITMACMPDQIIRLDDSGNGQITCSVNFPDNIASSAYQAPLEVELWYGYSKTIYKDMIIRRI